MMMARLDVPLQLAMIHSSEAKIVDEVFRARQHVLWRARELVLEFHLACSWAQAGAGDDIS